MAMKEFRKVPVHRSLTRQQLLAGCDRDLFFLLAMFCGLLLMSGLMSMYWRNVILAIVLWVIGIPILAKLAIFRSRRFKTGSGRAGGRFFPIPRS